MSELELPTMSELKLPTMSLSWSCQQCLWAGTANNVSELELPTMSLSWSCQQCLSWNCQQCLWAEAANNVSELKLPTMSLSWSGQQCLWAEAANNVYVIFLVTVSTSARFSLAASFVFPCGLVVLALNVSPRTCLRCSLTRNGLMEPLICASQTWKCGIWTHMNLLSVLLCPIKWKCYTREWLVGGHVV